MVKAAVKSLQFLCVASSFVRRSCALSVAVALDFVGTAVLLLWVWPCSVHPGEFVKSLASMACTLFSLLLK